MLTLLTIYVLAILLTACYAAFIQGITTARQAKFLPQSLPVVNWFNVLIGAILWPAYWVSFYAAYSVREETPKIAARKLGLFQVQIEQIPN